MNRPPSSQSTPLSHGAERFTTALLSVCLLGGFVLVSFALIAVLRMPGDDPPGRRPTRGVVTYDVDGDGEPEFAEIDGEVHAVPADSEGFGSLGVWLPFAGTLGAAVVGLIGAALNVRRVNREGGERVDAVERRLAALETAARPTWVAVSVADVT